jgi:hypothetical protein
MYLAVGVSDTTNLSARVRASALLQFRGSVFLLQQFMLRESVCHHRSPTTETTHWVIVQSKGFSTISGVKLATLAASRLCIASSEMLV